jgi:hypothetical protein
VHLTDEAVVPTVAIVVEVAIDTLVAMVAKVTIL